MDTPHKGSEFNNIIETWEQNERNLERGKISGKENITQDEPTLGNDLDQVIKQEASEYDNENKENRILAGERATVNDDADSSPSAK